MRRAFPAAAAAIAVAASLIATAGAGATTERTAAAERLDRTVWSSSFECTAPYTTAVNDADEQTCITSAPNARCVEKSDSPNVIQTCEITQSGDNNNAYILQDISTGGSSTSGWTQTQNSTQIASVKQQGNNNSLDATQRVNQTLKASTITGTITQNQEDRQSIVVCQEGAGTPIADTCEAFPNSGKNTSKIQQSRFASEQASGGTINQNQDRAFPQDCDPFRLPSNPNLCGLVQQFSTTSNDSDLHQQNHLQQVATGTSGPNVTQKQNQPTDGIDGHATQPSSTPQNSNVTHQHQTDDQSAPSGANQFQDPELGCCSSGSNVNGHQIIILRASEANAQQDLQIFGNCDAVNCLLLAHGKVNGAQATDRCDTPDCSTFVGCSEGECTTMPPEPEPELELPTVAFDTEDLENAINFVFPLSLPLSPL